MTSKSSLAVFLVVLVAAAAARGTENLTSRDQKQGVKNQGDPGIDFGCNQKLRRCWGRRGKWCYTSDAGYCYSDYDCEWLQDEPCTPWCSMRVWGGHVPRGHWFLFARPVLQNVGGLSALMFVQLPAEPLVSTHCCSCPHSCNGTLLGCLIGWITLLIFCGILGCQRRPNKVFTSINLLEIVSDGQSKIFCE